MRILVVQETDWIENNPILQHHMFELLSLEGHEIMVVDHHQRWRRRGISNLFFRGRLKKGHTKIYTGAKIDVETPPYIKLGFLSYLSAHFSHKRVLASVFRDFKPDVVVLYSLLNGNATIDLAHKNKVPVVFHSLDVLHQIANVNPLIRPLVKMIEKQVYLRSDRIISISKGLSDYAIGFGVDKKKITNLPPGVDFKRFSSLSGGDAVRRKLGINKDDIVLFFMGHYYNFCGLDDIIKNFDALLNEIPSLKLVSIGDGELGDELGKLVDRLGLQKNVLLLPRQDYNSVGKFLDAADIYLLPFKQTEAATRVIPSKILEYMAAGKPVVCGDLPSVKAEFGESGIIYEDEPKDFYKAITTIIESGKIKSLGKKARQCAKRYDYKKITPHFLGILEGAAEDFGNG